MLLNLLTRTLSVNEAGKQHGRIMLLWCHPSIYEIWPLKSFLFLKCLSISHWVYRHLNDWISLVFQVGFPFKTVARSILFWVVYNSISLPFRCGFHRRPEMSGARSWPGRNLGELYVLRALWYLNGHILVLSMHLRDSLVLAGMLDLGWLDPGSVTY